MNDGEVSTKDRRAHIVARLNKYECQPRPLDGYEDGEWSATCPRHRDRTFIFEVDDFGSWLDQCQSGCLGVEIADTVQIDLKRAQVRGWADYEARESAVEQEQEAERRWRETLADPFNVGGKLGRTLPEIFKALVAMLDKDYRFHRRNRWICPACGDRKHGGVRVSVGQSKVLIKCATMDKADKSANAEHTTEILQALGLTWADLGPPQDSSHNDSTNVVPIRSVAPRGLAHAHQIFRKWLGPTYDLDALNAVLATLAAEKLDGDPLWLLLVSGPGNAKTETVVAAGVGVGAEIISTISSEAALLSGTSAKERAKDATGGLLQKIGSSGVMVIKDMTSILSMNRDTRGSILGAFREIYDGYWKRDVGTEGGRSLEWAGRIAVVGAVTTAWDSAHSVISTMGDRFVLVRVDSRLGRLEAGRQAIQNLGNEVAMRTELSEAVGAVIAGVDVDTDIEINDQENELILRAADLVTLARTGVEYDYRGDVTNSHQPEAPTRLAKQLAQVARGARATGMDRDMAMRLALRCARDSIPPLRLAILEFLTDNPSATTSEVRKGIEKPRATVDRQLQALHSLGLVVCEEIKTGSFGDKTTWYYGLAPGVSVGVLGVNPAKQDAA